MVTTSDETHHRDRVMMQLALDLARDAGRRGEVPVGAVVARDDRVIAAANNLREATHDPTAHAERLALTAAGLVLKTWRLEGCNLYVTLEPCSMCAGAITLSRIDRLIYGAEDRKGGACRSLYRLVDDPRIAHRVTVTSGILAEDCQLILTEFFIQQRQADRNFRRGA